MNIYDSINKEFRPEEIDKGYATMRRVFNDDFTGCPFGGWGLVLWGILWQQRREQQKQVRVFQRKQNRKRHIARL